MSEGHVTDLAGDALSGVHASQLAMHVAHPRDDVSLIWLANGTAIMKITVWQQMAPPFPHAIYALSLAFEAGHVSEVLSVDRIAYGA